MLTSGELSSWLSKTTTTRRKAILFALELNLDARTVVELTWRNLHTYRLTGLAREILGTLPRHIKLPYVFWEPIPNGALGPLFGLHQTCLEITGGIALESLQPLYDDLMMYDARAEADDFRLECSPSMA